MPLYKDGLELKPSWKEHIITIFHLRSGHYGPCHLSKRKKKKAKKQTKSHVLKAIYTLVKEDSQTFA